MTREARHLSAESALYCRVFTEGLFGMDPVGFGKFDIKAKLPAGVQRMVLRNIRVSGRAVDIVVTEEDGVQCIERKE